MTARAVDVGATPELCEALAKKFQDFSVGVRTSSHLVTTVTEMAGSLIAAGHSGIPPFEFGFI